MYADDHQLYKIGKQSQNVHNQLVKRLNLPFCGIKKICSRPKQKSIRSSQLFQSDSHKTVTRTQYPRD